MSRALQRVVVRLLHDPAFTDSVYAGDRVPELSEEEEGWIRATDRRAWATDPFRRARVFQALVEELPVATAARGIGGWEMFFGSVRFHRAIQDRGVLVYAYGAWLGNPFATVEIAVARVRRAGWDGCARAVGVEVPEGTLLAWNAGRVTLGAEPVTAILGGARVTVPTGGQQWLMVDAAGVAEIGEGLCQLLAHAAAHGLDSTRVEADRLGAEPSIVDELVAEGILG